MFSLIHPGKQRWWKSQMIPLLLFSPSAVLRGYQLLGPLFRDRYLHVGHGQKMDWGC